MKAVSIFSFHFPTEKTMVYCIFFHVATEKTMVYCSTLYSTESRFWLFLISGHCQSSYITNSLVSSSLVSTSEKWREKVRFINESGFYFFFLFDSQIPAAYIRKRFNFESGLDSEKYGN